MSPAPHRRTIMFADISGSTGLFERLGQAEAVYAIERCLNRMKRSIEGYGGEIAETAGDELLATFGGPADACLAALDMHQRIADLPAVSGHKLSIRIGLHCGLVEKLAGKLTGEALTTTARIAGLAGNDQILASASLAAELGDHAGVTFLKQAGDQKLREFDASLGLCQIRTPLYKAAESVARHSMMPPSVTHVALRYRNKAFIVDLRNPRLTFGRDLGCRVQIEDRKASRQHAWIETRPDGFFLVDTSTNGSFVGIGARQEVMVRHSELKLEGNGYIAFGSSGNDPTADKAEFSVE